MEPFAVALVGEPDTGGLVEAASAAEAVDIVHGTVPRANDARRGELLVWTADYYRERHLAGGAFPDLWTHL